jgi:pantoate--beta-alanine ligase
LDIQAIGGFCIPEVSFLPFDILLVALQNIYPVMKVINTVKTLQKLIKSASPASVGLIPTMGALHKGHLSLVVNGIHECPVVVVSIYVNPTQFNDKEDLKNYPRTVDADLKMLGKVLREQDIVFIPDDREMYPEIDKRVFQFGYLDKVMEAIHRPGHFNGVAQVISRLFDIINPDIAYFGLKDFQQVSVIKELVRQEGYKVKISGNPIIREPDGLAMSSRNQLLEPVIRKNASIIYKTISEASVMLKTKDIPEIREYVKNSIEKVTGFSVEYFEIVDDGKLIPLKTRHEIFPRKSYYGCIAVKAGKIRLIDNIQFQLF